MNIDIEGTLAGNYFEKVNGGFYNSDLKNAKNSFLMPWNADIYHGSFQMAVGPSVTVAPFSPLSEKGLHFIKLNIYWHVGYQGSVLYFNESKSKNQQTLKSTDDINSFEHATKLMLGHGLTSTIGLNLSYKAIGLGYEYWRTMRPVEYESMDSKILDGEKNRFKEHVNRIYIQFRL